MLIQAQSAAGAVQTGSTGLAAFRTLARNLDARLAQFANEPLIAREIAYLRATIGEARDADAVVDDQRLFEFVLQAYDLEGQENAQALMRRVLSEDLSNPRAAANLLSDERYRQLAGDLGFAGGGGDGKLVSRMVQGYLRTTYEMRTGETLSTVTTDAEDQTLDAIAEEPAVAAAIAGAKAALARVASAEAVSAEDGLVAFASRAAGFPAPVSLPDDMIERLIQDPTFRKELDDKRYDTFASFFAPATQGRAVVDPAAAATDRLIDRWVAASFTLETGRQATGDVSSAVVRDLAAYRVRDDVAASIDEFRSEMASVTTPLQLLGSPKAYKFVLRGHGLDQFANNTDLVLATLTAAPGSRSSPAAFDKRFEDLQRSVGFLDGRGGNTGDPTFVDKLVERYVRVQFERAVGENDLGSRYALYASRRLPGVTSPFQILGDQALRQIVLPAIGLQANSQMDIDRLAKQVETRLDMGSLKDPDYLAKLTRRYFAATAGSVGGTGSSSSASLALTMLTGSSASGLSLDLLLQMQSSARA